MQNYKSQITNYKLWIVVAVVLSLTACGYHTNEGVATKLPPDLRSIAIPTFENATTSYRVEQLLTQAVVHEFTSRTNYRITSSPADADAVLHGTVTATSVAPLTFDSRTGRLSSAMVVVNMRVSLLDNKGKPLYENPSYSFRQQYEVSTEVSSFFQEQNPAVRRLSQDFARTLVSDILENY
jgi:outer membrane lipopolysaccharide assembly protein LptE/RlpB